MSEDVNSNDDFEDMMLAATKGAEGNESDTVDESVVSRPVRKEVVDVSRNTSVKDNDVHDNTDVDDDEDEEIDFPDDRADVDTANTVRSEPRNTPEHIEKENQKSSDSEKIASEAAAAMDSLKNVEESHSDTENAEEFDKERNVSKSSSNSTSAPESLSHTVDESVVSRILAISEAYNSLTSDEQNTVQQFINSGVFLDNIPQFIVNVLNVDPIVAESITTLKDLHEADVVDRTFMIIEMPDDLLNQIAIYVSVFTGAEVDHGNTRNEFSKNLVKQVDKLNYESIDHLRATESIISARC